MSQDAMGNAKMHVVDTKGPGGMDFAILLSFQKEGSNAIKCYSAYYLYVWHLQ